MELNFKSAIAMAGLSCLIVAGQSSQPTQSPQRQEDEEVVRITTNLVQVDAVVTDKKGNLVRDLRAEDFQVFEDGKPQKITHFSFVPLVGDSTPRPVATPPKPDKNAPPVPPVLLRPEQVKRTIALVVDDLGLSFESTHFVRDALKKFVAEQVLPGDLVAIIRTAGGIGALQQFTTDKQQLNAAIEKIRWYPNGRSNIGVFNPITPPVAANMDPIGSIDSGEANTEDFRQSVLAVGTLGALSYVIKGLAALPGRKAVVLFSDGLQITDIPQSGNTSRTQNGNSDRTLSAMETIIEQANRSSVVVYTIDARGLAYTGLTAEDDLSGMTPDQVSDPITGPQAARNLQLLQGQEGLNLLALQTGGLPIRNTNDISGGLRKVLDDQKGYYLIGYRPDASTFDAQSGRRRFHKLSIKVSRPGLYVRSRQGFLGKPDSSTDTQYASTTTPEGSNDPAVRNQQLIGALISPFAKSGITVRLTSLFGNDAKLGSFVRSLLHVQASDLTIVDDTDGWKKIDFDVLAVAFGDNGNVVDQRGKTESIKVRGDTYKQIVDDGFDYVFLVPIKKPGAYQFRTAIRDVRSQRVGSASQFVNVPDVKKDFLTLSGLVVDGDDINAAPSSAKVSTGSDKTSSSNESKEAPTLKNPKSGPAVRQFKAGAALQFMYFVYNPKLGADGKLQMQEQVRLFKDGKLLYSGPQFPMNASGMLDPKRVAISGKLHLGTTLELGQYVLQVVVTDTLAKEKHQIATQWIDFEVVG